MKIPLLYDIEKIIRQFIKHKKKINSLEYKEEQKMLNSDLYKSFPECLGKDAMYKLLTEFDFESVLDLGAGFGEQSRVFVNNGKKVTAISEYDGFDDDLKSKTTLIIADYLEHKFDEKFDCIWASHILEHQRNLGFFLDKVWSDLKDNGILAVSVPPREILAGGEHINCFYPGHLIYQLLLAGFDMRDMRLKEYGYNLSIICRKNPNPPKVRKYCATCFSQIEEFLPQYVVDSINEYRNEMPLTSYGSKQEKIKNNVKYKW